MKGMSAQKTMFFVVLVLFVSMSIYGIAKSGIRLTDAQIAKISGGSGCSSCNATDCPGGQCNNCTTGCFYGGNGCGGGGCNCLDCSSG